MITVETNKPVYSNAKGKEKTTLTPEEKKAKQAKQYETAKGIYMKGKESGLLSAIENLALNVGTPAGQGGGKMPTGQIDYSVDTGGGTPPADDKKPMNPYLKWGLIIGGVAITGFAVYWFGFRKKGTAKK